MLLRTILVATLACGSAMAADLPDDINAVAAQNVSLSADELDQIRGSGLPLVGLDQQQAAADASTIVIGEIGVRASDTLREFTDNWNLLVATPLIAAASARAG